MLCYSLPEAIPASAARIARLGLPSAQISYTKEKRAAGGTKWTLKKKLKAFADAFVSFSYAPLRAMSFLGMLFSFVGFGYALVVVVLRLMTRTPVQGWSSLIVVVLVLGGVQMMMLGVLGEYLWRTLEAARQRPPIYLLEHRNLLEVDSTFARCKTATCGKAFWDVGFASSRPWWWAPLIVGSGCLAVLSSSPAWI